MEIVHKYWVDNLIFGLTGLKDEIFVLCGMSIMGLTVAVYNRNKMAAVEELVELPDKRPLEIEACSVSNCVYVLCVDDDRKCVSVLRLRKDGAGNQFSISPFASDLRLPVATQPTLGVSPNGSLSVIHGLDPVAVDVFSANGSLALSVNVSGFRHIDRVIQRSDGNLVLASLHGNRNRLERVLTELGADGKILRQYKSSLRAASANVADMHGRIVICKSFKGMELLDSEFNILEFGGKPKDKSFLFNAVTYNGERNEVMSSCTFANGKCLITIFRFSEE